MPNSFPGARVRVRRNSSNPSQTAFGRAVGISPPYLNLIEYSHRKIVGRTLYAVARELGLGTSELAETPDVVGKLE